MYFLALLYILAAKWTLFQVERVMATQLGPDWRGRVVSFEDKPFAAASIGEWR